jgi:hypothetical protein
MSGCNGTSNYRLGLGEIGQGELSNSSSNFMEDLQRHEAGLTSLL